MKDKKHWELDETQVKDLKKRYFREDQGAAIDAKLAAADALAQIAQMFLKDEYDRFMTVRYGQTFIEWRCELCGATGDDKSTLKHGDCLMAWAQAALRQYREAGR